MALAGSASLLAYATSMSYPNRVSLPDGRPSLPPLQDSERANLSQQAEVQLQALQAQHQLQLANLTAQQAQASGQVGEMQRQLAAAQAEVDGLKR